MSHGKVAKKRYKTMDHRGDRATFGQGCITDHQKRSPAPKKHAYSTSCHRLDRMPSSNGAGTCHPIRTIAAASQQKIGCPRTRPNRCPGDQHRNRANVTGAEMDHGSNADWIAGVMGDSRDAPRKNSPRFLRMPWLGKRPAPAPVPPDVAFEGMPREQSSRPTKVFAVS